ncbi:MAG: hypothetical protein KJ015_19660 [Myxococcales bacterium]|nr:hypothetical protein [Myxococcales bacterium]
MSFASYTYIAFLFATFVVHWLLPVKLRKPFLVVASYVFYCSWDWRFGFLLAAVSVFSWAWGLLLVKKDGGPWLLVGVVVELLPLLYFKYTNFFLLNVAAVARAGGATWRPDALSIILPLGVSFFTFQGIAYLVDIASGEKPFRRLSDFLLFKGFWPQLIAGPIIRPEEIREQIEEPRQLDYGDVSEGTKRILSGLFKKVVVADTLAPIVDAVFLPNAQVAFVDVSVAVVAFGLQIYCDFAGYSEIAIGSARLFGYRFPENFDWPYLARSPQEFWQRWHMTLSRWIRDYVFTPLSFMSRRSPRLGPLWLVVAMALCGLWHGAAWTFVLWGLWHGTMLVANQTLLRPLFAGLDSDPRARARLRGVLAWGVTSVGVFAGWLLFRAQNLGQVGSMLKTLVLLDGGIRPRVLRENEVLVAAVLVLGVLLVQLLRGRWSWVAERIRRRPRLRAAFVGAIAVLGMLAVIVLDKQSQAFVYFQF